MNKWDLIKPKSFCPASETINKMKKQPIEGKKILAKRWTRAKSPKYTNSSFSSITNKKYNQKMGRRSKQTFLQRRHADRQQTHEKMLNITDY